MPPATLKCSLCVIPHLMFLLCDLNPLARLREQLLLSVCMAASSLMEGLLVFAVWARLKIRGGFCACLLFKQLAWMFVCILLWVQVYPVASRCCSRAGCKGPVPCFYSEDCSSQHHLSLLLDRLTFWPLLCGLSVRSDFSYIYIYICIYNSHNM